jgi:hypothetical protein
VWISLSGSSREVHRSDGPSGLLESEIVLLEDRHLSAAVDQLGRSEQADQAPANDDYVSCGQGVS